MYFFIYGLESYMLFLLFTFGSFLAFLLLSWVLTLLIFILFYNYGAFKAVNLPLMAALVSSGSLKVLYSHYHFKKVFVL